MNRPRIYRWLRIAFYVVCALAAVLLLAIGGGEVAIPLAVVVVYGWLSFKIADLAPSNESTT